MHEAVIESRTRRRGLLRRKRTEWRAEATDGHTFLASPWTDDMNEASDARTILATPDAQVAAQDKIDTQKQMEAMRTALSAGHAIEQERAVEKAEHAIRWNMLLAQDQMRDTHDAAMDHERTRHTSELSSLSRVFAASVELAEQIRHDCDQRLAAHDDQDMLILQDDGTLTIPGSLFYIRRAGTYWQLFEAGVEDKIRSSRDLADLFAHINQPDECGEDQAAA